MQLFHSPTTPFGRKVLVLLIETGQLGDVTVTAAGGSPLASENMPLSHNPLGKIPALVLDDGRTLFDSRVICRYLDDRAGGNLYPAAPALWDVLTLEATADGMLDAAILAVYEARLRPPEKQFPEWAEAQLKKVDRALDAIERQKLDQLNAPLNMGQIVLGCALSYLDFRHGQRNWREGRPGLSAWEKSIAARPSFQETVPKG
ncbi:MAG: glutathione S-transferase [Paracoccaceae bacterium]